MPRRRSLPPSPSSPPSSSSPSSSPPSSSSYSPSPSKSSVRKGKPRYISQRKLQSIVVCDHEKTETKTLTSIRRKKLIQYTRPIGQKPVKRPDSSIVKAKKEPELQSFGCKVLKAIENFVRLLHKNEYTLKGKLKVSMLCWVKSSRSVKLRKDAVAKMEKYTPENGKMDYISIGSSIRDDLFKGQKLPVDLDAWIDLMLDDPIKYKYLIRYHSALQHRRAKMDHFLSLYEKLLQVKKLADQKKLGDQKSRALATFLSIVNNIPVASSTVNYVWTERPMANEYVEEVYNHKREGRSCGSFGLLIFVRDCIHHLMDYSVKDDIIMFGVDDKYLMIEACFPGIFHQFQFAMSEAGFEDEGIKES